MSLTRSYNPVWFMVDLNGKALDSTFYMFTLQNTLPYLPQPIFIDENATPASDPIQFLANGTLPIDLYWDDEEIYRIEIRQGNTQSDPLIYEINNYSPLGAIGPIPPPTDISSSADNQVTNPQFSILNFTGSFAITTAGTYNFAPGWYLDAAGTGTVTLSQDTYTGNVYTSNNATNASYGLRIVNNGFTTIKLRQRFNNNGALWTGAASLGADGPGVAVNFTASSSTFVQLTVELEFSDSTTALIGIQPLTNRTNEDFPFSVPVPFSTSAVAAAVAYTDLAFSFQGSLTVDITSIQLVPQDKFADVTYIQTSLERQQDQMFHYYNPQLQYKPIPSYLIGWDFAFNPCQELGKTPASIATGANGSAYMADQLIVFQTVDNKISAVFDNTGVTFAASGNTSFALVQYLDAPTAVELLNQRLAFQLQGKLSTGASVTGTVKLYWTMGVLPTITTPSFDSLVTSITAGVPNVVGGWNEVPRIYGNAAFTFTTTNQVLSFSGWDATQVASINTASFFAVVITLNTMASTQTLHLNYASLVGGDIPTRPAPKTADEVLRECEYYYEKSLPSGVLATSASAGVSFVNAITVTQQLTAANTALNTTYKCYPTPFGLQFNVVKRVAPNIYIYSPKTGTVDTGYVYAKEVSSANTDKADFTFSSYFTPLDPETSLTTLGLKGVNYFPTGTGIAPTPELIATGSNTISTGSLSIQFLADARFGVI